MKHVKKAYGIALFLLFFAVLSACSNNQQAAKVDNASTVNQAATKEDNASTASSIPGNEVFQKSCVACHSTGDITGGKLKIDSDKVHTDFKTQEDLLAFVSTKMPKKAPGSLSQEEYNAVVKYLWDQK